MYKMIPEELLQGFLIEMYDRERSIVPVGKEFHRRTSLLK